MREHRRHFERERLELLLHDELRVPERPFERVEHVDFRALDQRLPDYFAPDERPFDRVLRLDLRALDERDPRFDELLERLDPLLDRLDDDLRPPLFDLLDEDLRALAEDLRAGDLRADDFLADDFRAGDFLADDLRADDLRAGDFLAAVLRDRLPDELRDPRELDFFAPPREALLFFEPLDFFLSATGPGDFRFVAAPPPLLRALLIAMAIACFCAFFLLPGLLVPIEPFFL